ncbi:MAG: hypothetical protein H0T51_11020 [Pirellulales bacterium]|nr:hypothetical protein [Pirellulales bacterium]
MSNLNASRLALLLLITILWYAAAHSKALAQDAMADRVDQLVEHLNADEAAQREAAEKELIELGLKGTADSVDAFLNQLPKPNDNMPQEVQTRLARVASEVRSRIAKKAVDATRLTLDVKESPLTDVLAAIEKQTGNRLTDYREQFGQEAMDKKVTLKIDDEPFWSGLDNVLDAVQMQPYAFSGEENLALVERDQGALRRSGRGAAYSGPFRIEATNITAQRGLRSPDQSSLRIDMEIAWEPRLKPIALTQAAGDVKAIADDGREVPVTSQDAAFDVEVDAGAHAAEVTLPLQLPAREAKMLKTLTGKLTALVPGRIVDLKFDNLAAAKEASQEAGGVTVIIDRVVQNQALWEIHMRIKVESLEAGLESHRGWVFQNVTFLQDKAGEKLDNAGFETTMQTEKEAGFVYLYELPEGRELGDYVWIYRTPSAIVSMPVEYKLEEVPLP